MHQSEFFLTRFAKRSANLQSLVLFTLLTLSILITSTAQAANWSSSNVQILRGSNFELGDNTRTILTYENALGWNYGDSFFFLDVTEPTDTGTSLYAEFSPRFSLGKISGSDLSFGIVKDVMIATNLEMAENSRATLIGIGLPLDLPGFAFADINLYVRDSDHDTFGASDNGYQITLTWKKPFSLGTTQWSFEGFFDYAFGEDGGANPKEDNIITAPRLLIDIGSLWGTKETIEAGIEYQIWRNKFGIDGVDEDTAQLMVKWIF